MGPDMQTITYIKKHLCNTLHTANYCWGQMHCGPRPNQNLGRPTLWCPHASLQSGPCGL